MKSKIYDIITIGDMCVDIILSGDDVVPEFGQVEKLVDDYYLEMGGSANIFACQAAKLGMRVGILGKVGDDLFGQIIIQKLEESGVDVQHVIVDPTIKTGMGVALCPPNDRAILTFMGSICAVQPDDVKDDFLASARHFHHASFFLHTGLIDQMPDIFTRAKTLGLTTSLDTNWDPAERWNSTLESVLALTDIFMPNDQEALHISGCEDFESAANWIRQKGVSLFTLKLGSQGARLYSQEEQIECIPEEAPLGGDSIGAGDSFDAGFLAGWLRGLSFSDSMKIACECGRSVASAKGGILGQPYWDQVSRLIRGDNDK